MDLKLLKELEKQKVSIVLQNNFKYSNIVYEITELQMVKFTDKHGAIINLAPEFIVMISEMNGGEK